MDAAFCKPSHDSLKQTLELVALDYLDGIKYELLMLARMVTDIYVNISARPMLHQRCVVQAAQSHN